MKSELKTIDGVPQIIYRLPLADIPGEQLLGLNIKDLIDKIIIGPTNYSAAIKQAFTEVLENAGVENVHEKIIISNIPIRT